MRNISFKFIILFFFSIIFFRANDAISQVDTESLRKIDMKVGLSQNLQTTIGLRKGNTEFFALSVAYRLDTLSDKYHAYGVGNLNYQDNSKGVFQRSGFLHLRFLKFWTKYFSQEVYAQKQFDYFRRLKDRNIVGGGLRFSFDIKGKSDSSKRILNIYAGTGLMYENELLNIPKNYSTNLIRSASYLNITWIPSEKYNVTSVTYFQQNIFNKDDYRILNISSMNFNVSELLTFVFQFNYRYDSQPPLPELKTYDFEIRNGINFTF